MFYAINTLRNNTQYKSIDVFRDMSLQETKNNRWIAPESEIESYGEYNKGDEIELIFVAQSQGSKILEDGTEYNYTISPYFRAAKNKTGIKFKKNKDHQRVQNFLFNYIINNQEKLKLTVSDKIINSEKKDFYFIKLSELNLDISTLDSEVTVKTEDNTKRADIFVEINNEKEIYGKGLCIEIQLSSQSKENIEKRTYQRALLGMSTIWIFKKDFEISDSQIRLKTNEFIIHPYINVLNETYQKAQQIIRLEYEKQGILLDNKIREINKVIDHYTETLSASGKLCQICLNGILVKRLRKKDNKPFIACSSRGCNNIINML